MAAGTVEDYAEGSARAVSIKAKLAVEAGVAATAVTLLVTAASVNIEATIAVPTAAAATTAKDKVAAKLSSAEAASSFLGVQVTSAATVSSGVGGGGEAAKGEDPNTGVIIGGAVGGVVAVIGVMAVIYMKCVKKRHQHA